MLRMERRRHHCQPAVTPIANPSSPISEHLSGRQVSAAVALGADKRSVIPSRTECVTQNVFLAGRRQTRTERHSRVRGDRVMGVVVGRTRLRRARRPRLDPTATPGGCNPRARPGMSRPGRTPVSQPAANRVRAVRCRGCRSVGAGGRWPYGPAASSSVPRSLRHRFLQGEVKRQDGGTWFGVSSIRAGGGRPRRRSWP